MTQINSKLLYFFVFILILLAGTAAHAYKGSMCIFALFSLVFCGLLINAFYRGSTLGYKFLVVFLWLGFWLKLVLHLLLNYSYLEPVGRFDATSGSWDSVLLVSLIGAFGVMVGNVIFSKFSPITRDDNVVVEKIPYWYPQLRLWLWLILFFFIAAVEIVHFFTLLPNASLLPSPYQGLIVWFLGFGLIALVVTMVHLDEVANFRCKIGVALILIESVLSSLSLTSRAIYIFHTLPLLIVLFSKKIDKYSIDVKKKFLIFIGWLSLFFVVLSSVLLLRYSNISPLDISSDKSLNLLSVKSFSLDVTKRVSHLLVDRWIGLEGVMTVAADSKKSVKIFVEKIFEHRQPEKVDSFTNQSYGEMILYENTPGHVASTGSGSIALFYFSGSLLLVFIGMVCLVILMLTLERLAFLLTANIYLCSIFSMSIGYSVASLSVGVRPTFVYFTTSFFLFLAFYGLHSLSHKLQRKV